MIDRVPPTAEELVAIRASLNLSADAMGQVIGYGDPGRTIRGLEAGERHGKPYSMSGTATAALTYAMALKRILDAYHGLTSRADQPLEDAMVAAVALLPKRMLK